MQTEKHQISYERGIVENIAQHLVGQQGMEVSLLWLENYNPNIEHKSLIKRLQHTHYSPTTLNWKDVNTAALGAKKNTTNDHVLHCATALLTANPESHETFVLFGNRVIDNRLFTAVPAYAFEYDPLQSVYDDKWRDPQADQLGSLATISTYKGWRPAGEFQDYSRFSESLLFVTIPREVDDFALTSLAACYKWAWFDITKKRDNERTWWNGLSFPKLANKEESTWMVFSPSSVLQQNKVAIREYEENLINLPLNSPIEIVVAENDLAWYDPTAFSIANSQRRNPYCSRFIQTLGKDQSCPEIEIQSLASEELFLYTYGCPNLPDYEAWIRSQLFGNRKLFHYANIGIYTRHNDADNDALPGSLIGREKVYFSTYGLNIPESLNGVEEMLTEYALSYGNDLPNPHLPALIHAYPNYIQLKIPRPFTKDEVIPIILTASIGNNEILLYEGDYTVKQTRKYSGNIRPDGLISTNNANNNIRYKSMDYNTVVTDLSYSDVEEHKPKYFGLVPSTINNEGTNTQQGLGPLVFLYAPSPYLHYDSDSSKHVVNSIINFTIRIDKSFVQQLIENGVTSLNLYASRPSDNNGHITTVGTMVPQAFDNTMYMLPKVKELNSAEKYSGYGLVKKFLIDGDNTLPQWDIYNGQPFATNAWVEHVATNSVWAVPIKEDGTIETNRSIYSGTDHDVNSFTPDFILWDYPTDSEPLNLEFSGKTWKGKGARLITVVKGEVFLGGTIDEYGQEEQGTVRYCLFQSGVPLYDIFPLENKIQIGHLPHTALVEYREQLIWFNKQQHFRMVMPSIFEPATWEFLDSVDGGGTYSQKTVCKTPHGVVYCNDSGIWLTDGRIPENLTDQPEQMFSIRASYEHLMRGNSYEVKHLWDFGTPILSGSIDATYGHNSFAELNYDDANDELVLSSPIYRHQTPLEVLPTDSGSTYHEFTHEIRFIFSFAKKNWRTEVFSLNGKVAIFDNDDGWSYPWRHVDMFTKKHKTKITNNGLISTVIQWSPWTNDNSSSYTTNFTDMYVYFMKQSTSDTPGADTYRHFGNGVSEFIVPVIGSLVTHVIGDNMNDSLLRRFILGTVPRGQHTTMGWRSWTDYTYDINTDSTIPTLRNNDPIFAYNRRSENHARQLPVRGLPTIDLPPGWVDLMAVNMSKYPSARNPWFSSMQTPGGINWQAIDVPLARESLIMHAPMNTPFRRLQLLFASEVVVKLHDFVSEYNVMRRRTI